MTPERWQQVKMIFNAVLEQAPDRRAAFLDEACAGDEALRREVASLLASEADLGSFIAAPVVEDAAGMLASTQAESIAGQRIGPYRVVCELGHGGMGAVYLAARADDEFKRQVAIKLIKRGMDTDFIISRFRHERQILASFDHPNIARLLDGGTTEDGLPYFVMEYIEGQPISQYCDEHRLNITERVKLFRQVCAAVHYAHQNLVIHRDLKPSNLLVTADGIPKLLDFGIAKILNPGLVATTIQETATAVRLMTPEYASPEQVRGEPITTASDVYSLGVVLYELLTGHRPYRFKNWLPHEIARAICETEPERPSTAISRVETITKPDGATQLMITPELVSQARDGQLDKLRRRLAGDLDNIVLMAMRKEAQRRYSSVEQFSEDLRRHLAGLPVIARKDTLWYRGAKFVKRHKAGVAAAALIVVSLLGGIIESTRQARLAERRFNDVRQLANSFLFEFHDAIETLPGSTPVRELVVKRALEYLDKLAQEARSDQSLLQELATAYQRVGDVQGRPGFANLGDKAGALTSYRKALQIRERLLAGGAADEKLRLELATNHDRLGDSLRLTGNVAQALEHYRQSLQIREALSAAGSTAVIKRDLASSYTRLGDSLAATGNLAAAIENHRQALAINETLASDPANTKNRRVLFVSHIKIGNMLDKTGDVNGALKSYQQGLKISKQLSDAAPMNAQASRELAACYDKVGNILLVIGDHTQALEHYQQAQMIRQKLVDPKNAELRRDLSISFDKIGNVMEEKGELAKALANYREALKINQKLAAEDQGNAQLQLDVSISHRQIGDVLFKSNDLAGALASHRQALEIRLELAREDEKNTEVQHDLAESYDRIGEVLQKSGDTARALENYREALKLREALAADRTNSAARAELASTCAKLGQVYSTLAARASAHQQAENWREARSFYQRSLEVLLDLRTRGALSRAQSGEPDRIAAELAKCDAALTRLHVSAPVTANK
jgi:serine/threonine protein kinase/predicted negative regulator of RcsB-dependent stress response